jgi:TldD protein
MKQIADWALGMAVGRGASHAEARIVNERVRSLGTRNGRVAVASESESLGLGVRVLAEGGWGFAATQEMTQAGVDRAGFGAGAQRAGATGGRAGGGGGVEYAV